MATTTQTKRTAMDAYMAPVHFFGIASNGKVRYAEQLVTRDEAGKLVWSWTGASYRTVKEAQVAIEAKNLAISQERYG